MKVGVTGATGVLGKIFLEQGKTLGYTIVTFDGDIRKKVDIRNWLYKHSFDAIIHFAALVPVNAVNNDILKAFDINVGGTINLLVTLNELKMKPWFFYASSSHVYKSKKSPISEEDTIEPVSDYGLTKYMGEQICLKYLESKSDSPVICCGRIFSFFHNTQKKDFLYSNIISRLETEDLSKPFKLYGANCQRDFLNAEKVVGIIIELMKKKAEGVYNIASGNPTSIRDFVQNLTPRKLNIESLDENKSILVANIDKLNDMIKGGQDE